jgi:metacaspase-1
MAGDRKALCVGINNFKNFPGNALQGCINDANDMEALLKKYSGFAGSPTDVTKLTDSQATKANIMAALGSMVKDAKAGKYSYLVFSLSSHGTQVPDRNNDEPDHYDEAFCPTDLAQKGNSWDPAHIILDDELHDLFAQLPKNVLLEVYLDTCHSGSGLKAVDLLIDRRPRYIPPPSFEAFARTLGQPARRPYKELVARELDHHILWAGCKASQTSSDAHIGNAWHGAFTYYFCQEINACNNTLSRAEILKKVAADLKAGHYTQSPQLECEAANRKKTLA